MSNPVRFEGFGGYLLVEQDGDSLSVVGLTGKGYRRAIELSQMVNSGATVEEMCDSFGWNIEQFRIFYFVLNYRGILDEIE